MLGKFIYAIEPKTEITQIDMSLQAAGLYFVKINIDGNIITRKIQINR